MSSQISPLAKFYPINDWREDTTTRLWKLSINGATEHMYLIDMSTQDRYLNQHALLISIKCGAAALGTPIVHTIALVINVIYRIFKCLVFYELWKNVPNNNDYKLKKRFIEYGKDCLRILISPLILPILELSAIYGLIRPNDGRKLYANTEIAFYGQAILGRCFQANQPEHLLGGDINNPGAW